METKAFEMSKTEKIQMALELMRTGKSRQEAAEFLGYTNHRSLDNAFRLEGYIYDKASGRYVEQINMGRTGDATFRDTRADEVVAALGKPDADVRDIAKRLAFDNPKQMGKYMTSKGYVWDGAKQCYVKSAKDVENNADIMYDSKNEINGQGDLSLLRSLVPEEYVTLIQYLMEHQETIERLIEGPDADDEPQVMPRYTIPGVSVTKSVHMSNELDHLVRDYSKEKNMAQRDIFVVALVRFFLDFGYEKEIKALLGR